MMFFFGCQSIRAILSPALTVHAFEQVLISDDIMF